MSGYDAFLDRALAEHNERGIAEDALEAEKENRALWISRDAGMFLEWIAERDTNLWDIKVKSSVTGQTVDAAAALIAHAPAWMRELVLNGGEITAEALMDTPIQFANGSVSDADMALIAYAPEWLRAELTEWLSKSSLMDDYVKAAAAEAEAV